MRRTNIRRRRSDDQGRDAGCHDPAVTYSVRELGIVVVLDVYALLESKPASRSRCDM
uniref:Uncharacterized protein n=1 Tax=Hyaloperonospora arabidopsidis (strain Emoy2) TaxID=559515 RepID=M4BK50_HYAAE